MKASANGLAADLGSRQIAESRLLASPALMLVLPAILLFSLMLAPSALASKGVVGTFGTASTQETAPGGAFGGNGIDIKQSTGDVYAADASNNRIQEFTASGAFVRAWGFDVVKTGGVGDVSVGTPLNEKQSVTLTTVFGGIVGGTFTLSFNGQTTGPIPYNASASSVESALQAISSIGSGNVAVTGSAGGPWTVEFRGSLAGLDFPPMTGDGSKLIGEFSGFAVTVTVATTANGGSVPAYEVCTVAADCKPGLSTSALLGPMKAPNAVAVDQADGAVYVEDKGNNRVQKFSGTGTPLFTFGKAVNKTQVGSGFEICPRAGFPSDECQAGTTGEGGGEFGSGESNNVSLSVVPSPAPNAGNVIVTDPGNRRLQEFNSSGEFVRAFGWDVVINGGAGNQVQNEIQKVTVSATSGTFTLTFEGQTTVALAAGVPAAGGVGAAASVQNALQALSKIGSGNVAVTGGPGDATGSSPYIIEFIGTLKDKEVPEVTFSGSSLGAAPGKTVSCTGPATADSLAYQWLRNGAPIAGATSSSYEITGADVGAAIQCQTFAKLNVNGDGSTQASVPVTNVSPLPGTARPVPPSSLPNITWTSENAGQTLNVGADGGIKLNCSAGSWTGSPTFSYQWYRNGVALAGHGATTTQYTVQTADLATGAHFQCAITATNAGGSVVRMTGRGSFESNWTTPEPSPRVDPLATVSDLVAASTVTQGARFEVCTVAASCKAASPNANTTEPGRFSSGTPNRVIADSTGAIYALVSSRIQKFTPQAGVPALVPSVFGIAGAPNDTVPATGAPQDLANGPGGNILVEKRYPAKATAECFDGNPSVASEVRVQELSSDGLTLSDTHASCAGLTVSTGRGGVAYGTSTGNIYLSGTNGAPAVILNNTTPPSATITGIDPTRTTAVVTGTINPNPTPGYPNPPSTAWKLQYRLKGATSWTSFGTQNAGAGVSSVPIKLTLTGLLPNTEYEVRVIATKTFNSAQAITSPETLTTDAAPPAIQSTSSTKVTESSASLNSRIDPRGSDSSYHFEYGFTPSYGSSTPEVGIGGGQGAISVSDPIEGLSDNVYHFRVVAKNDAGETTGEDQTFEFHPPSCPNAAVRQQTQSNYLPDCRGYEITTPEYSGNPLIWAFRGPTAYEATSPSRFAFSAVFGAIPDTESGEPPNTSGGLYVATRTSQGWKSKFVGLPADQTYAQGGPPGYSQSGSASAGGPVTSPTMDRIVTWNMGNTTLGSNNPYKSNAPYVWDATGKFVERWPTNLGEVENGSAFLGETWTSEDLNHFVFTSDIPFTATGYPGAIYDNNTATGAIEVVSKTDIGTPFVGSPQAISRDGSHILMTSAPTPLCTAAAVNRCPAPAPAPFYMRIDGASYSVSKGYNATFAGMTRDGSTVYFTTAQKATEDDHDTSVDLYMWKEATDAITRVSVGSGATGDRDDCTPVSSWTAKCGIKLVSDFAVSCTGTCYSNDPSKPHFFSNYSVIQNGSGGNGFSDSFVAAHSGDIYFLSPEQLDGSDNGVEGGVNLYVYREGKATFVAELNTAPACHQSESESGAISNVNCAETSIARMEVTPDGSFAAFLTPSRLTSYDNKGQTEMYRYDANAAKLICVSCLPSGEPPSTDVDALVQGSMNGLFTANDGRVFFSRLDSLVPEDTNKATDVYEYVDGRAQLISQGTGPVSKPRCSACGLTSFARPGLVGVSADGTDVYFTTFDVLTPQDKNGGNLKVYDARTNGGFVFVPDPPGCAAADECHGPSTLPPPPIVDGSGADLGIRGNVTRTKGKHKRRKHKAGKPKSKHKKHPSSEKRG